MMKDKFSRFRFGMFLNSRLYLVLVISLTTWTSIAQVSQGFRGHWEESVEKSCRTAARTTKSFFVGSASFEALNDFCVCVAKVTVEGELRDPDTGEYRSEAAVDSQLAIFKGILDNWSSYETVIGKKTVFDLEKLSGEHKVLMDNQLVRMEACDSK